MKKYILTLIFSILSIARAESGCNIYIESPGLSSFGSQSRGWTKETESNEKMKLNEILFSGLRNKGYKFVQTPQSAEIAMRYALWNKKSSHSPYLGGMATLAECKAKHLDEYSCDLRSVRYVGYNLEAKRPFYESKISLKDIKTGDEFFANETGWYIPQSDESVLKKLVEKVPSCTYK